LFLWQKRDIAWGGKKNLEGTNINENGEKTQMAFLCSLEKKKKRRLGKKRVRGGALSGYSKKMAK